jgi:putative Mg2+ transporter-C (MgtC) family protein
VSHADILLLPRIGVGFVLAYILGFERQIRGAPAGDRTFALVGTAATAITAVTHLNSPQAVAGVVTGIGFIGGGVLFHGQGAMVRGITTAATIFAAAGVGVVVGYGHLLLGTAVAAGVLLTLEIQHIPFLRWLDARSYKGRFVPDEEGSANGNGPSSGQRNSST